MIYFLMRPPQLTAHQQSLVLISERQPFVRTLINTACQEEGHRDGENPRSHVKAERLTLSCRKDLYEEHICHVEEEFSFVFMFQKK